MSDDNSMTAIRMPKRFFQFIQDNPRVAQVVGSGIVAISQCEQHIADVKEVFSDPASMETILEKGTKEELAEFLKAALDGSEFGVQRFDDLPDGTLEKIKEELGENVHISEFPVAIPEA